MKRADAHKALEDFTKRIFRAPLPPFGKVMTRSAVHRAQIPAHRWKSHQQSSPASSPQNSASNKQDVEQSWSGSAVFRRSKMSSHTFTHKQMIVSKQKQRTWIIARGQQSMTKKRLGSEHPRRSGSPAPSTDKYFPPAFIPVSSHVNVSAPSSFPPCPQTVLSVAFLSCAAATSRSIIFIHACLGGLYEYSY